MLGNTELDGVRGLVDRLMARGDSMTPEQFVDGCLDMTGPVQVTDDTHAQLVAHASREGDLSATAPTRSAPPSPAAPARCSR